MVRSLFLLAAAAAVSSVAASNDLFTPPITSRDAQIEDQSAKKPGKPKKLVDPKKLANDIKRKELEKKGKELEKAAYSTPARNRVFSSQGHLNTLDFIESYFKKVSDYYTWSRQEFKALYSDANGNLTVNGVDYDPIIFQYSPSTTGNGLTANFVQVANLGCNATDYPATVSGQIALISRGTCPFGQKSALAGAAGAAGAVIYNNAPGTIGGGTLGEPTRPEGPFVPTAGITQENGTTILTALQSGQAVQGLLQIYSIIENRTTFNIIAQTKGGDQNDVVVLGGHSDSVEAGPGINDDGSGIIGVLETAVQLAKYSTKSAVRFAFWSAEEFGLLGSTHYVTTLSPEEAAKIKLYLNFDMIASPNYVYGIYDGDGSAFNLTGPPGSDLIEHYFADFFKAEKKPSKETEFSGRSDYGPFLDAGIPAGGLFTGAEDIKTAEEAAIFGGEAGVAYDKNYHGVGDNYSNLNFEAFVTNTRAIASSVAYWSANTNLIPARNSTAPPRRVKRSTTHKHPHARSTVMTKGAGKMHDCGKAPKAEL